MNLKFKALECIRPVIARYQGIELEDSLWIFENSTCALGAALAMRKALRRYNKKVSEEKNEIHVTGYGIHEGSLLFIEGTDIHWGDPVNTSSKLG